MPALVSATPQELCLPTEKVVGTKISGIGPVALHCNPVEKILASTGQ